MTGPQDNQPPLPRTLLEIIEHTRDTLPSLIAANPDPRRDPSTEAPRGFLRALTTPIPANPARTIAVIAEVKRMSPSAGLIRPEYAGPAVGPNMPGFCPERIASSYQIAGASAISCLTEEKFFAGHTSFIGRIRAASPLPVLRKDFIIHPWQIHQSTSIGADALLLIAECLSDQDLALLIPLTLDLGMDILLESHDPQNLSRCLPYAAAHPDRILLGINNRDLTTMTVDLAHSAHAAGVVPDPSRLVSESGISTHEDLAHLNTLGIKIALIGESLMRTENPGNALRRLLSTP